MAFVKDPVSSRNKHLNTEKSQSALETKYDVAPVRSMPNLKPVALSSPKRTVKESGGPLDGSSSDSDNVAQRVLMPGKNMEKTNKANECSHALSHLPADAASDPTLPSEVLDVTVLQYSCILRSL